MKLGTIVFKIVKRQIVSRQNGRTSGMKNCRDLDDTSTKKLAFAFGWNPKTLMNEDVGSIPLYRKANDVFKIFFIKN